MGTNEKLGQDANQADENCLGRRHWFNACCYCLYFTGNVQLTFARSVDPLIRFRTMVRREITDEKFRNIISNIIKAITIQSQQRVINELDIQIKTIQLENLRNKSSKGS